jgi:hypothetical protein
MTNSIEYRVSSHPIVSGLHDLRLAIHLETENHFTLPMFNLQIWMNRIDEVGKFATGLPVILFFKPTSP